MLRSPCIVTFSIVENGPTFQTNNFKEIAIHNKSAGQIDFIR